MSLSFIMKALKLSERSNRALTRCQGQTIDITDKACAPMSHLHDIFYAKQNALSNLDTSTVSYIHFLLNHTVLGLWLPMRTLRSCPLYFFLGFWWFWQPWRITHFNLKIFNCWVYLVFPVLLETIF